MAQDNQLACRNVQNSATNRGFFVSVSRYASSKSVIFATNFGHFNQALDYEQALSYWRFLESSSSARSFLRLGKISSSKIFEKFLISEANRESSVRRISDD